jgi:DNA polymerase-1
MPRPKDGDPIVFPRERFVDYRAMSGDSSDDLPGIPGVGSLTAAKLLSVHPLDDYLANPALIGAALGRANRRVEEAFRNGTASEVVARNRQLMDLRQAATRYDDLGPYRRQGTWDESAFRGWLEELRAARLDTDGAAATIAGVAMRAG